jgi:hypothetical protein
VQVATQETDVALGFTGMPADVVLVLRGAQGAGVSPAVLARAAARWHALIGSRQLQQQRQYFKSQLMHGVMCAAWWHAV